MPALSGHVGRAHSFTGQRAGHPELHPAQLGHLMRPWRRLSFSTAILLPFGEPERRSPPSARAPPHLPRGPLAARPIQIHQRLLQTVTRHIFQPQMLTFGVGQLFGLELIVHPRPTSAVLAALLQTSVPHRPTRPTDPLRELGLLVGELNLKPPPRQHDSAICLRFDMTVDHRQRWCKTLGKACGKHIYHRSSVSRIPGAMTHCISVRIGPVRFSGR